MKHGLTDIRLYKTFTNMKQRCYNPKDPKYSSYGGKGVTICGEWLNDFQAFYDWSMNNGYDETLTIDRIDGKQGYSPNNCRWTDFDKNRSNRTCHNSNAKTLLIRQERIKRDWTLEFVGHKVGLQKSTVQQIVTKRRKPSHGVLVKLENLFGLSHRELFEEVDGEKVESR